MPSKLDPSIVVTRNRLETLLRNTVKTYAPTRPVVELKNGQHNFVLVLCFGKGKDFYNIGRWMMKCITVSCCKTYKFITPPLDGPQLSALERIWVDYHRTGRKYGFASPAPHLLATTPQDLPPVASTPTSSLTLPPQLSTTAKKRNTENENTDAPRKRARIDPVAPSISSRAATRSVCPVIDLTRKSGHRVVLDLTSCDSDLDAALQTTPIRSTLNGRRLTRKARDQRRLASMRYIGTIELD